MDEYTADQVLCSYERIECALIEYSAYIPLLPANEILGAPVLVSFLIDACGILDSLFRDLVNQSPSVQGNTKKRGQYNIQDYAECFSIRFNFPHIRTLLLEAPPRYLTPFQSWLHNTEAGHYETPAWWKAYNNLKHDRLVFIQEGTLGAALNAICALHQMLARTPQLYIFKLLMRKGWIQGDIHSPDQMVRNFIKSQTPSPGRFIFQTKLFSTPTGKFKPEDTFEATEFPENIDDIDPAKYRNNQELIRFLGRAFKFKEK